MCEPMRIEYCPICGEAITDADYENWNVVTDIYEDRSLSFVHVDCEASYIYFSSLPQAEQDWQTLEAYYNLFGDGPDIVCAFLDFKCIDLLKWWISLKQRGDEERAEMQIERSERSRNLVRERLRQQKRRGPLTTEDKTRIHEEAVRIMGVLRKASLVQ